MNRIKFVKTAFAGLAFAGMIVSASADEALKPYLDSGELPGAISVLYDNGREQVSCFGWADVDAKRPVTLDTPFMQCSQTKGFCGVTIAKLVEEGRLDLDDPVSKYLPEFKTLWIEGPSVNDVRTFVKAKNVLTVRMCLNHTGGFPFETPIKAQELPGGGWSGGARIRPNAALAAAMPLKFEPGTKALYSNTGIDVAAAVVETVTGKRWEDYLRETVLDPLGMGNTTFWPTDAQIAARMLVYNVKGGQKATVCQYDGWQQPPFNDDHVFASAGAGLWTTARDQLRFYKMLMNGGVGENGVRILKEETVRRLLATSSRPAEMEGYSLGLWANQDGWFGHGGHYGTNCMVDGERKRLKLWVVQQVGGPRPWDRARDEAANEFFKSRLDTESADAYTGRTH